MLLFCNVENKSNFVYKMENFKILSFALQNISADLFYMQIDDTYFSVFWF